MEQTIARWPGKSAVRNGGSEHPAIYHMLDVAAVAEQLVAPIDLPAPLHDALILLVALHDLGKISLGFRAMLQKQTPQPLGRHWEMTEVLLHRYDAMLAQVLGGQQHHRQALYAATAGHHGRPPDLNLADRRLIRAIGTDAVTDAGTVIAAFSALWPRASLEGLTSERINALGWWLPGLVSAADWIGSNIDWFAP